ncbi:MAG: FAD-dependent oxidoreductase [Casimicrobiaceae bacterium]
MAARGGALRWLGVAGAVVLAVVLWRAFDLGQLLTLDALKSSREALAARISAAPVASALAFFALYVAVAALSLPGAAVLTLAAGALFGFTVGLVLVSFASTLGALLAFLAARYLFRDAVKARFGLALAPIDAGIAKDGAFYLLSLRLIPAFPFWLVNLLMGLTSMSARRYTWVSQLGMLPGTAVYVNAGTQLATIASPGDILSPGLLGSFVLLGIFPLIAKAVVGWLQGRRVYAAWKKPARFDRNLVVIGAGAGGLVTAYIAAAVKAKVTLIEAHRMGGDCLNSGCVPSKTLIRAARAVQALRQARAFGVEAGEPRVDFAAVMARVREVIRAIEPHDSAERYRALGVEVLSGYARLVTPWAVEITSGDGSKQTLTARTIVLATGAAPFVPPIPGLAEAGCLTSDTVWSLEELPRRLVVLGGGPIGCELAQSFARLGSAVTQVEMAPRLLIREDPEVSETVRAALEADGVRVLTGHEAVRVEQEAGERRLIVRTAGQEFALPFDRLLCAVGRAPRVEGYGLDTLGISLTPRRTIEVDDHLQTRYPNILAVGDVAGPNQFTHAAAHQAWYAAVNALFGRFRRFKVDYRVMPWATFTEPEVARVGLSEEEAKARGVPYEVTRYGIDELDRAIAEGVAHGFVKVLTEPGRDRILGVTIVGEHAGDLIAEFVLAMKHGLGLGKILGTIHIYPTLAEANKYAAGEWKRAHAPERLLRWVARYHDWQRG